MPSTPPHTNDDDRSFHLAKKTGEVTKVVDRGTSAIQNVLSTIVFSIAPQVTGAQSVGWKRVACLMSRGGRILAVFSRLTNPKRNAHPSKPTHKPHPLSPPLNSPPHPHP